MVLSGIGAGLNELIALAGTAELVPVRKRGLYVGFIVFTILPFCPSTLWAQLIAQASSWRYVGILVIVWNFIGLVMVAVFYFPPPRVNSIGMSRKEVLRQIDYVGGLLSIGGMILFMAVSSGWVCNLNSSLIFLGHAMGRVPVSLDQRTRPRSPHSWSCHDHRIFLFF